MLLPGLRPLARRQARSVPLQFQHRLKSTTTRPRKFSDFLSWARKTQQSRQLEPSPPRSGSGGAQGNMPPKTRSVKKTKGPGSSQPKHKKKSLRGRTREERILETVAMVGGKKPASPAASSWQGEDWKPEDWGLDRLRPPPQDEDPVVEVEKPNVEHTRKLEGVLKPLGSPVLRDVVPPTEQRPIPTLAHKLDRVLFNPGVHWLQEPRSGVYNFTPWLQNIPDVNDFAFERLPAFMKSSRDEDLWGLAKREGKIFGGSTSSLTGMLSQVYFLISGNRSPDTSSLSKPFRYMSADFTPGQRMPASVLLNYKDGVYAIDSAHNESDDPDKNVLIWLGTLLEKYLTMPPEEFRRLLRDSPDPLVDSGGTREAYRYAKSGKFVMRSQLDCHDPRLPGTGVFDLKTRAALPIRLDLMNYKQHSTYLIRTLQGGLESFEREYHDLMRSAFLKYGFQARIGNMDGVLVVHHNTARIFGFRYIPLSEIEECLFGEKDRGEAVFEKCVLLLEEILMEIITAFPSRTIRCLFETCGNKLNVFVEPEVHDENEGPRPIVHMVVQSTNYVDGDRTSKEDAMAKSGEWDLHWTITHSSLSQEEKENKLNGARERQQRPYWLPPGVSVEEMEGIWNQLDFGGKQQPEKGPVACPGDSSSTPFIPLEEKESTFDPSSFLVATGNILSLRKLSMKGKADMETMLEKTKGQPKLVWGEPEAYQVGWGGVPSETEVPAEASEIAGEQFALSEETVPVGEDVTPSKVTVPSSNHERKRRSWE